MAEALLQIVLEKLSVIIGGEIALLWGVNEELEILSSNFSAIRVVLEHAEEKQLQDKQIKDWLRKLNSVSYELDDILDEWQTEASKMDHEGQKSGFSKKVQTWFLTTCSVGFRHKIGKQIKRVTKKLDEIAKERHRFHLREKVVENGLKVRAWRETSSLITEPQVYGREKDQEEIVQLITRDVNDCGEGITVLPIVGIGGLGKTTLAKLIFNDERAKNHFEPRIWICVSEDFDLRRITKAIIESITSGQAIRENSELDLLQRKLSENLFGKRYLLVLDDVWNEDIDKWDKLKASLDCGSRGAFVLTTTRSDMVARIMGTLQPHSLSVMSKGDCLSLFKNYAFGQLDGEHPNLVEIGEKIVDKCGGLPLAAKTLGSLLYFKTDENQWNDVLESEIWNLKQPEGSILPALRLSYFHLPFSARQCFGYCGVFLKDTEISKEKLIYMWMASGLLSSGGSSRMENRGEAVWNELYQRSFFQIEFERYYLMLEQNEPTFVMHDLMHDLAHSVIEEEHLTLHLDRTTRTVPRKYVRHITAVGQYRFDRDLVFPEMMYEFQSLRTLIFLQVSLEKIFIKIDFTKFVLLRVLDAQKCSIKEVPSSIGSLIHLRYLNLSSNGFEGLPKSICNLRNLQTLDLCYCYRLRELPKHMRRLRNLRHLFLQHCEEITKMPPGIGYLTNLQTLPFFIVDEREEDHGNLSELQGLDLRGSLELKHLERVGNPKDAEIANLVAKQNLRCLGLKWIDTDAQPQAVAEQVLEALQPHSNLEALRIEGYKGTHLSHWVFGQLPRLQKLHLVGMEIVEYCVSSSSGIVRRFPSLEYMYIEDMPNLIGLSRSEESSYGRELFPLLHSLEISGCPKLTNLPTSLPPLKHLCISICPELRNLPTSLPSLTHLNINECPELTNLPTSLPLLKHLNISECPKLTNLPTSLPSLQFLKMEIYCNSVLHCISHFQNLTHLNIEVAGGSVDHVTSFSEGLFGNLAALVSLRLAGFTKLKEFPADLANLTALENLHIEGCSELPSLPDWLGNLSSLQTLRIYDCPQLKSRCEKEKGEDWPKIKHIRFVDIDYWLISN